MMEVSVRQVNREPFVDYTNSLILTLDQYIESMKAKVAKKDEIAKAREEKKAEKESKRLQILAEKETARQQKFHAQQAKALRKSWEAQQNFFENNLRSIIWEQGSTQGLLIKPLHLDTPYHASAWRQQMEKLKRKQQISFPT
ncbi:hypothetical protein L7F22_049071 [Adiantum nelumboides]|nr:hypothetical protein [Adiantum nelumboides]